MLVLDMKDTIASMYVKSLFTIITIFAYIFKNNIMIFGGFQFAWELIS